jgi:hypothetical protein
MVSAGFGRQHVWTPAANWGWGAISSGSTGYITYQVALVNGVCNIYDGQVNFSYNEYSNWTYYDTAGTSHSFGLVLDSSPQPTPPQGCTPYPPPNPFQGSQVGYDGSGYTLAANAGPGGSVTSPSGVTITPPGMSTGGGQSTSGPFTVTDSNGNKISTSTQGTTFTDTLGTTALTLSGSPASPPVTYTWKNPSGSSSQITVNYASKIVETNFGCSGVTDYGRSTQINQNLVSSIGLPDGTSYTLTYESTPHPVHAGAVTGRIASVALPTGGTISYAYTGSNNGIMCSDGSAAGLNRTTPDSTTPWAIYARGGDHHRDRSVGERDCAGFPGHLRDGAQGYQGSSTKGTLLETVDTCYNGAAIPCTGTGFNLPISNRTVQVTLPGASPSNDLHHLQYLRPAQRGGRV